MKKNNLPVGKHQLLGKPVTKKEMERPETKGCKGCGCEAHDLDHCPYNLKEITISTEKYQHFLNLESKQAKVIAWVELKKQNFVDYNGVRSSNIDADELLTKLKKE